MGLDLKNMSFKQAAYIAKIQSGLTSEDLAELAEESHGNIAQWFREHNNRHHPSPHKIPKLCRALGNNILLEWQQAQLEELSPAPAKRIQSGSDLLSQISQLGKELGDVHKRVNEALEDGVVDQQEASDLAGELRDVEQEARRLRAALQPVAGQGRGQVLRGGEQKTIRMGEE